SFLRSPPACGRSLRALCCPGPPVPSRKGRESMPPTVPNWGVHTHKGRHKKAQGIARESVRWTPLDQHLGEVYCFVTVHLPTSIIKICPASEPTSAISGCFFALKMASKRSPSEPP